MAEPTTARAELPKQMGLRRLRSRIIARRQGPARRGFIYVIQCGDLYKIGFSANPDSRLRELSTGSPHEMRLVMLARGDHSEEWLLHQVLRIRRHRGEWFDLDQSDMCVIARVLGGRP